MLSLPFREGLQSVLALALMLCAVAAPLIIGLLGAMPHFMGKLPTSVRRYVPVTSQQGVVLPAGLKGSRGPACVRFNVTEVEAGLRSYFNFLGVVLFLISCLYASVVMGQPIEYRYFFFEVLLAGGRLKAFVLRYCAVLAGTLVMGLASAITASVIPYLNYVYGTITQALIVCGKLTVLAALAGASFGVLASLVLRSVSNAFLAGLGFAAVALATSNLGGGGLSVLVTPTFTIYGGQDPLTYLAVITVVNVLSVWRVVRIEY